MQPVNDDDEVPAGDQFAGAGDVDATTDGNETTVPANEGRRSRVIVWAVVIAATSWTIACLAAGVWFGSRQQPEALAPPAPVVVDLETYEFPELSASGGDVEATSMVNVLGLTEASARAAVADAGINHEVQVQLVPRAGEAGIVVNQDPPPGAAAPDEVVVYVSESTDVPDVVGWAVHDALAEFSRFGARVTVESSYVPAEPAGQVLEVDPTDGLLPGEVTLTVTAPAAALDLLGLEPVEQGCARTEDPIEVDGGRFAGGLLCTVGSDELTTAWNLGRRADRVTLTTGISDVGDIAGAATVLVRADGDVRATAEVAFGESALIDVDVSDVLRLEIVVVPPSEEIRDEWSMRVEVAVVDASVLGGADEIDMLAGILP